MNTTALCVNSYNPNLSLLNKMLTSAQGFDEKLISIETRDKPSCTAAEGFNKIISQSAMKYIVPFCDDDFFHSDNLTQLMSWFKTTDLNGIDIIYFPIFTGNERDGWVEQSLLTPTYEGLREQNMLPFSCFYRKSLWEKVGGYENIPFCDWYFWLKALKAGATLYRYVKPIYYFRTRIEERLSDRERKIQSFDLSRQQLLERIDNHRQLLRTL